MFFSLDTVIVPSIKSTRFFAIAIPSPVPCTLLTVEACSLEKAVKIDSMKSGLIPIPVSRTEKVYNPYPALLPADCETFTVIVPPSGVNFIALLTQFIRT